MLHFHKDRYKQIVIVKLRGRDNIMKKKSGKFSVLIVDDATFVRTKLKKVVEKMDFAEVVGEASNGLEAISLYKKLNPDLVTMDLVMPNIDGIQAIEDIMAYDKNAKMATYPQGAQNIFSKINVNILKKNLTLLKVMI